MIVVIQCAATKAANAGHLVTADGKVVTFVAHPEIAPKTDEFYARPDDDAGEGRSWREVLLAYNGEPGGNPLGLLPAYQLYKNPTYERLVDKLGMKNVYILSAGWGLIRSDFLTPYYDITFSNAHNVERYKRRKRADPYKDIGMLPNSTDEEILFFGGKDYVPLFCKLTSQVKSRRKVFYNAAEAPQVPGCATVKFDTHTRTNWHYECAIAFLESV